MNVLFVASFSFESAGGVGTATRVLTEAFVSMGHNVTYLALCKGSRITIGSAEQYFITPGKNKAKVIGEIAEFLDQRQIGVIIHQVTLDRPSLSLVSKANRIKALLFTVHHNCIRCIRENYRHMISTAYRNKKYFFLINNPLSWRMLLLYNKIKIGYYFRFALAVSDRVIFLSPRVAEELPVYVNNYPGEKVHYIGNPASFPQEDDDKTKKENRILYVGRLNYHQKRLDLLLEIWRNIYTDLPDWELDIVGDGPDRSSLERSAEKMQLERITFHGFQDPRPFFKRSKYLFLTSAYEGLPMVFIEGFSYGVIPFSFNSFGAIYDIIEHQKTGYIIQQSDTEEFSRSFIRIAQDEDLRFKLETNCRREIRKYDPGRIAREWQALFNQQTINE